MYLKDPGGNVFWQANLAKMKELSFLGTPLYACTPIPLTVCAQGLPVVFEHPDVDSEEGLTLLSVIKHEDGGLDILVGCPDCGEQYWRPHLVSYPNTCGACDPEETLEEAPEPLLEDISR